MSTDYHIYCRSCEDRHDFDQFRAYQVPILKDIIRNARAIAALSELIRPGYSDVWLQTERGRVDIEWFVAHAEHDLVVIDEYGRIDGTCGERVLCWECKAPHNCALEKGHEGQCSSRGKDGRADAVG